MLVFASVWQDGRTSVGPDWKEIRMAKIVNSWNDWDPLKRVIVGRPTPLQWNQAIGTPDFRNDSMMT